MIKTHKCLSPSHTHIHTHTHIVLINHVHFYSSQCTAATCKYWPHCTSQSTTCQSASLTENKNKIYVRSPRASNDPHAGSRSPPTKLSSKPPMIPVNNASNSAANNSIIFLGEREMPITRERNNYERTGHHATSQSGGATRITINGDETTTRAITNDPTRFYVSSRENKSR